MKIKDFNGEDYLMVKDFACGSWACVDCPFSKIGGEEGCVFLGNYSLFSSIVQLLDKEVDVDKIKKIEDCKENLINSFKGEKDE